MEEESKEKPRSFSVLRKQILELKETKATTVCGTEYQRIDSCTDRQLQKSAEGPTWIFRVVLVSPCVRKNYLRLTKKANPPQNKQTIKNRGKDLQISHRAKIVFVPTSQMKIHLIHEISVRISEDIISVVGHNYLQATCGSRPT